MENLKINPMSMVVNIVFGWFVLSFVQALIRAMIASDFSRLWGQFIDIALFRHGLCVAFNAIVIIVFGGIGTILWFLARK